MLRHIIDPLFRCAAILMALIVVCQRALRLFSMISFFADAVITFHATMLAFVFFLC